jgi:predicted dehydrogenase
VASPASTHFENAYSAIEAGKSVLIEKPIATRIEDARLLIDKASQQNIVLAVGHQERLVFEAMGVYDIPETPTHIEARRMGRWSGRGIDVSVTLDLLIHDADLVISIFDETGASDVKAQATNGMSTRPDDIVVNAEFPSGQTTRLSASRIADKFERFMRIEYPSGTVEIDFIARTLKNTTPFELDANVTETIIGKDPLAANVERFIDAVLGHPDGPAVCGPSGLRALTFALQADHAAGY